VRACFARAVYSFGMKLYANVRVLAVEENSFTSKESGEHISYCKNYLKDDSGAVVELSSGKKNFSASEGKAGVATIELRQVGDKWTPKVVDFAEGEEIDSPEGEIA